MNKNRAHWLKTLRADMASVKAEAARQLWPSPEEGCPAFFNYRLEHVRQAEREALALLALVGGIGILSWPRSGFTIGFSQPSSGQTTERR